MHTVLSSPPLLSSRGLRPMASSMESVPLVWGLPLFLLLSISQSYCLFQRTLFPHDVPWGSFSLVLFATRSDVSGLICSSAPNNHRPCFCKGSMASTAEVPSGPLLCIFPRAPTPQISGTLP